MYIICVYSVYIDVYYTLYTICPLINYQNKINDE